MFVINRKGEREHFNFAKTHDKILSLSEGLEVNVDKITQEVISTVTDGITTSQIDSISSIISYQMGFVSYDYQILAYRILNDNLRKTLPDLEIYLENEKIRPDIKAKMRELKLRPWDLTYMGLHNLKDGYLLCQNGQPIEKPEFLLARVACEIGKDPQETFNLFIDGLICHSSPILFNAGTFEPQMTSCFLSDIDDSVDGITKAKRNAVKHAAKTGGIGMNISRIRPAGSLIKSTGKYKAVGIVPVIEAINSDFLMITQGGRRNSSCAISNAPWHPEFKQFLMAKNERSPIKGKSLFYAIWMCDEFMERVKNDLPWYFINKDLTDFYGPKFKEEYNKAIVEGKIHGSAISARSLWTDILLEQCGNRQALYFCFGDQVNKCSNMKHIGVIPCSNLCTEIMEPSGFINGKLETATCNLGSIALPKCINHETNDSYFDYSILKRAVYALVDNINNIIDKNYYVTSCSKRSSLHYRPMGIGIQGLNDMFVDLGLAFHSEKAHILIANIMESMYYYALKRSAILANIESQESQGSLGNQRHDDFEGSDLSKGIFHWEHYFKQEDIENTPYRLRKNWSKLRPRIIKGVKNAYLIALMPTVSTNILFGNSPSFEQYSSLIEKKAVAGQEFILIIPRLYYKLKQLGLWKSHIVNHIKSTGSLPPTKILNPEEAILLNTVRHLFKTSFEEDHMKMIDMVSRMQPFVDQSMSFNWFLINPTPKLLNEYYKACWAKGIKTANYYIHRGESKKNDYVMPEAPDCGCSS